MLKKDRALAVLHDVMYLDSLQVQKTMVHSGGTVMGIEQCVYVSEHVHDQLAHTAPTAKLAFPPKERGAGERKGHVALGVPRACLRPGPINQQLWDLSFLNSEGEIIIPPPWTSLERWRRWLIEEQKTSSGPSLRKGLWTIALFPMSLAHTTCQSPHVLVLSGMYKYIHLYISVPHIYYCIICISKYVCAYAYVHI